MGSAHAFDYRGIRAGVRPDLLGRDAGTGRGAPSLRQLRQPAFLTTRHPCDRSVAVRLAVADPVGSGVDLGAQLPVWCQRLFHGLHDRCLLRRLLCGAEFLVLRTGGLGLARPSCAQSELAGCDARRRRSFDLECGGNQTVLWQRHGHSRSTVHR